MKARTLWFFLLVVILALVACGGDDDKGDKADDTSSVDASSVPVPNTLEPTDQPEPTLEPTDMPPPEIAVLDVVEDAIIGTGTIRRIAWSPDSQQLAVGAGAGVLLYDAADLSVEPTLLRIKGGAWSSAYSPDGLHLATSNVAVPAFAVATQFVHLWDLETGERIAEFETGQDRVERLTFSADGSLLVGAAQQKIYIWDATTLDVVEDIAIESGKPLVVAISPDKDVIAWGLGNSVYLHMRSTGEEMQLLYGDDRRGTNYLVFSPDGTQLAAGTDSRPPLVFDRASGEMVYQGSDERVSADLRYDAEGNLIVSGDYDVKKISPLTGEIMATYRVKKALLSPDETRLIALDGLRLVLYDAATGDEQSADDLAVFDKPPLVLPDYSVIIARQWSSSRLHLLDPADGALVQTVTLSSGISDDSITLSPDGSRLAVYTRDKTLLVVDTATWEEIAAYEQATSIRALAFDSDNTRLVVSARQGQTPFGVRMLDAATGEELWFTELETEVVGLIFSPDNTKVFGVAYKAFFVFNAAAGEILHETNREDQPGGTGFTYPPDGGALILYGGTGFFSGAFINVYDPETGELIESVAGQHNYGVTGVIFSADGARMVTVGSDVVLREWDAAARQVIAEADVLPDEMLGVAALNAEATRVVTTSQGGVLQIWTIAGPP